MEVSPSELMNILNRIIAKRKTCLCVIFTVFIYVYKHIHTFLCVFKRDIQHGECLFSYISDDDLKTDGFSIESCRSMVAVMDVSFLSLVMFMCCVRVIVWSWQGKHSRDGCKWGKPALLLACSIGRWGLMTSKSVGVKHWAGIKSREPWSQKVSWKQTVNFFFVVISIVHLSRKECKGS